MNFFLDNIKKPWLKATLKEIKYLINNQNFLIEDQNEGKPVTTCTDIYKTRNQSDGSLDGGPIDHRMFLQD